MQAVRDSRFTDGLLGGSVELQEAHRARKEERYIDALVWYEKSVALNNPKAMWELSKLYDEEIWGLIDILSVKAEELLLKAVELGFEPAMMEHAEENHQHVLDLTKSKYYHQLIASKDPYVMARLFYLNMMANGPCTAIQCRTAIKLYQDAIDAGYFECYSQIYAMAGICLSIEERSEWLLKGASSGDHCLQCELGFQFDIRSKENELQFLTSDHAALHWYLKAIKQSDTAAMKAAQKIYFDKTSECFDRSKGVKLVVILSGLAAKRYMKIVDEDHVSQYSVATFKVLLGRLRALDCAHSLSDDDLREMWVYGRLLIGFPVIGKVLQSAPYNTDSHVGKSCLALYSECTRKARQVALAFLLAWRKSPELWTLNRDVATIIAKQIYASRREPLQWLSIMNLQAMTK
jgi:TPR repeat protein